MLNHRIWPVRCGNLTPWRQKRWKIIKFQTSSFRLSDINWVWSDQSSWKSVVSDMSWEIWWKICFVSRKVIASLIDGPLTSAKNYGRPNSSESEKLIRNKTILSLSALRIGLWFLSSSFWPHLTLVLLVWPFTFMIQPVTKCILIQIILVDEIDDHR